MLCNSNVGQTTGKQKGYYKYENLCNMLNHVFIQETSFKYWPNKEERTTFGNFSVELVSDDPGSKSLIRHIMKVTNSKEVIENFY